MFHSQQYKVRQLDYTNQLILINQSQKQNSWYNESMYRIGAHVSIGNGYLKALEKLREMGGNTLQIFSSAPRSWKLPKFEDQDIKKFQEMQKKYDIQPIYFHASYLINLGDFQRVGFLSKKRMITELNIASLFGIQGSIVHLGSFKQEKPNYLKLVENIHYILKKTPDETLFIIENAGNRKIGKTIEEIGYIIKLAKDKRIKVCLDTCHLHSAKYDISTKNKLDKFLRLFDKEIGLDRLALWHINDSRDPFGSFRDRHENIGQGTIGLKTFETLLKHPLTKDFPFIIETPGFDNLGPDKRNIDILKRLTKE